MGVTLDSTAPAEPVFLPRRSRWLVSCDLGQSMDPTAICVLEHVQGVLDARSEYDRHCNIASAPQKPCERFFVRHLERLKLGTPYPVIVQHVKDMLTRPPLCGDDDHAKPAELIIDATGVGRAVADLFEVVGLSPQQVTITAGTDKATNAGLQRWHVPKTVLISQLDALLHTGELKIAAGLTEADAMKGALLDFRRSLSAAGRATYQARANAHDDLLLAVAIATWWARRPEPPRFHELFGTYGSIGGPNG